MAELFALFLIGFGVLVFVKLFSVIFKTGLFVAVLPFKILGAFMSVIVLLIVIPLVAVPVIFSLFLPILLIGLAIVGLMYLLK